MIKFRTDFKNRTGEKFGKLTLLSASKIQGPQKKITVWKCRCDCGKITTVTIGSIVSGMTKSCGCLVGINNKKRLSVGTAAFNRLYNRIKAGAKESNRKFLLTKLQVKEITSKNCTYCNKPPLQSVKKTFDGTCFGDYLYNGIDRVNNKEGYILSNCVPCCFICNKIKHTMELSDFIKNIENIYLHYVCKHTTI